MRRAAVRRPARSAFAEFFVGLLAGVCVSLWISSSSSYFALETLPPVHAPAQTLAYPDTAPTTLVATTPLVATTSTLPQEGQEWQPKARLPGFKTPTILCIVLETRTSSRLVDPRVINATWGARCDYRYFIKKNDYFPSIPGMADPAPTPRTWELWRQVFAHKFDLNYDYAMVVEDMTYAVPDNVRYEFRGLAPGTEALFWGRPEQPKLPQVLLPQAFVLSRTTLQCLQQALEAGKCALGQSDSKGPVALGNCVVSECQVQPRSDLDPFGKHQVMGDPFKLLEKVEVPAHLLPGEECCSVLPLAYMDVGRSVGMRSGTFSYHYYYDYFIRDTAVYGKEYMRPLNGVDAGVGKPQIGF
ncbi:hypothetical protein BASA81_012494 [Batrachochytrium salamandrivorans]|nr:hypothetical protein BASA81_012494 [Batrachochytrium salamandrivorans]